MGGILMKCFSNPPALIISTSPLCNILPHFSKA